VQRLAAELAQDHAFVTNRSCTSSMPVCRLCDRFSATRGQADHARTRRSTSPSSDARKQGCRVDTSHLVDGKTPDIYGAAVSGDGKRDRRTVW
jgi:hypothetical protein